MAKVSKIVALALVAFLLSQPVCAQVTAAAATPIPQPTSQNESDTEDVDIPPELSNLNARIQAEHQAENFSIALPLARQALKLAESTFPAGDARLINPLNNLGRLAEETSDLVTAREMFQRAAQIAESTCGPYHPKTASSLNNLAGTYDFQGEFQKARPLYERALSIQEKVYGKDNGMLIATLLNLAGVVEKDNETSRALNLRERALAIAEKDPDTSKSELALCLQSVALTKSKKPEEGLVLLQKALKLLEESPEVDAVALAETLNNVAMVSRDIALRGSKDFTETLRLMNRASAMYESKAGPEHLQVSVFQNNLGDINTLAGNREAAQQHFMRAAKIIDAYTQSVLPTLPLAEQQSFITSRIPAQTSLLLSTCSGSALKDAYDMILRWKGLLIESMRRESALQRLDRSPATHALVEKLQDMRSELAGWYQSAGSVEYKHWKAKNDALTNQKEQIEAELAKAAKSHDMADCLAGMHVQQVAAQLAADEALVDIYQYKYFSKGSRYAAIVLLPAKPDHPVFVDLGDRRYIDESVSEWREDVHEHTAATSTWAALKKLTWNHIQPTLGPAVKKVWLCPEGELARIPWHLFPLEGENMTKLLTEVDSVRELVALKQEPVPAVANSLLIAGGLDFDANPTGSLTKPKDGISAPKLPGTIREMQMIAALARQEKFAVSELTNAAATRKVVMAALPKASYVHLATHGFFFDDQFLKTVFGSEIDSRAVGVTAKTDNLPGVAIAQVPAAGEASVQQAPTSNVQITPKSRAVRRNRNPLVESGLLLSSSNLRDPATGLSPGVLTAEELVGIDLRNCKMMTLSACETGLGSTTTGQGIMGLRASLLAAGANCVLISLWKVPDAPTVKIMEEYYKNLWVKHLTPAESLNRAQATLRQSARSTPPILWAAWVLVGKSW